MRVEARMPSGSAPQYDTLTPAFPRHSGSTRTVGGSPALGSVVLRDEDSERAASRRRRLRRLTRADRWARGHICPRHLTRPLRSVPVMAEQMPPTDQDYGSRDLAVRAPAGNVWSFGTYRPTLTPA